MAFQWSDIQVKENAYSVRQKLNMLGNYGAELITTQENLTIPTSSWVSDTTYSGYNFKAVINIPEVKQSTIVFLIFSLKDQLTNNYAGGEIKDGSITIYSITKPTASVVIPNVILIKGGD